MVEELLQTRFHCAVCSDPVITGEGFIAVDRAAARRRLQAGCGRESGRVNWFALHDDCRDDATPPAVGESWYRIDVGRVSTVRKLLAWALHLQAEPWLTGTDWSDFALRAAAPEFEVALP